MEKEKDWFKRRGYLHLTGKAGNKEQVLKLVQSPKLVAKHAFSPLIHKKVFQRKYKIIRYNEDNRPVRAHKKVDELGKVIPTKKIRPLHYASHIDSHIYSYYSNEILQKKYEEFLNLNPELSRSICAYRRIKAVGRNGNKSSIDFAKEAFDEIKKRGECCAIAIDIKSFFSNLDHQILKKSWSKLLGKNSLPPDHYNVFKSVTRFRYVLLDDLRINQTHFNERKIAENRKKNVVAFYCSHQELRKEIKSKNLKVYKNQYHNEHPDPNKRKLRGIPQGLPISAMLANLYLLEFDKRVLKKIVDELKGFYRRYSDDIIILCDESQYEYVHAYIAKLIKEFRLEISTKKTEISFFRPNKSKKLVSYAVVNGIEKKGAPFNYLGFEFYGEKTLIKSATLSKFYRRMKYAIKRKSRFIERAKKKELNENVWVNKRKLLRIYSHFGKKSRKWKIKKSYLKRNKVTWDYEYVRKNGMKEYRGNTLSYFKRASEIMNEPGIRKQMRNHWKIFNSNLKKHNI